MAPQEWEAYTLHLQRVPVETIEAQTGLTRPRIAAAVDLGQLHAQAVLTVAADRPPATPNRPRPQIRRAVKPQLPGATIPPGPKLPEHPQPQPAPRSPAGTATAPAAPAAAPGPGPRPAAAPAPPAPPDLDALARSPQVRAWAAADGWTVPAAGARLPGAIVLAYIRAHGDTP